MTGNIAFETRGKASVSFRQSSIAAAIPDLSMLPYPRAEAAQSPEAQTHSHFVSVNWVARSCRAMTHGGWSVIGETINEKNCIGASRALRLGIVQRRFSPILLLGVMARQDRATQGIAAMSKGYFVYILASRRNGTLYVGVTNDLGRRVWEHREGVASSFTRKYGVKLLVHYEMFDLIADAIHRETRLKKWNRKWKLELIEKTNPAWNDLYERIAIA